MEKEFTVFRACLTDFDMVQPFRALEVKESSVKVYSETYKKFKVVPRIGMNFKYCESVKEAVEYLIEVAETNKRDGENKIRIANEKIAQLQKLEV